jgi:hypothetical protein
MKRNILFGFLLIGLVVMEWGCGGKCGGTASKIDKIDLDLIDFKGNLVWDKPIRYDSISFKLGLWTREVSAVRSTQSSSAFACDPVIFLDKEIVRSNVLISKKYSETESGIKLFAQGSYDYINFEELWMQDSSFVQSLLVDDSFVLRADESETRLSLAYPPTQTDTFQFTFQFFDTEGNMFETTTDPIIITP